MIPVSTNSQRDSRKCSFREKWILRREVQQELTAGSAAFCSPSLTGLYQGWRQTYLCLFGKNAGHHEWVTVQTNLFFILEILLYKIKWPSQDWGERKQYFNNMLIYPLSYRRAGRGEKQSTWPQQHFIQKHKLKIICSSVHLSTLTRSTCEFDHLLCTVTGLDVRA